MTLMSKFKERRFVTSDIRKLNYAVIVIMVLNAILSIFWSINLHILAGDFYNGILSAKLVFRERDFTHMSNTSLRIFSKDLAKIADIPYFQDVDNITVLSDTSTVTAMKLIQSDIEKNPKKPNVPHIPHIYRSSFARNEIESVTQAEEDDFIPTVKPKVIQNHTADLKFLATMYVDAHQTRWLHGTKADFIYKFPFVSEIVAIIWTAMCLIFQTNRKRTCSLPKPWRIVIPSMVIFASMFIVNLIYMVIANVHLRNLCNDLRATLTNPDAISCGAAIAVLRPLIRPHTVSHDTYLFVLRFCYTLSMLLWLLALCLMLLRYIFAIDFQLIDVDTIFGKQNSVTNIYAQVLQNSPTHQQKYTTPRSEDDFQSAKSHISEVDGRTLVAVQQSIA